MPAAGAANSWAVVFFGLTEPGNDPASGAYGAPAGCRYASAIARACAVSASSSWPASEATMA